ncbi:MAG: undecaprenyl-diphosphate phosphatase [Bacteroidetes bacterium]|nr:MAG: undecaprenyl-diphosphate phosphatase [Bacteroidota bacterium]TNE97268.1 MAG: undecaprenyl-diphosphate phosphatase [Bacteroidota bacterium]
MGYLEAIILAIIEGLTEFLPVSSTGHMIIASTFMDIASDDFTKLFTVAIQFGAILSVVIVYFKKFFQSINFYTKLFVAFIPTGILGLLLKDYVDQLLENIWVVAISLLLGGIILLFVDKWFESNETEGEEEVSYKTGFLIGIFQSIAMIPGVSRSAATIIGGLTQKLTRKTAAEFSFFLAVPTMFAATVKSMWDERELLLESSNSEWIILLIGNLVAFIVAYLAIKSFISFLSKHGFRVFGYYRIILGLALLILLVSGVELAMVG